jgi:actin-related protein
MSSSIKEQDRPLILDIGSNYFRMGWAGDDFPDIIAPSIFVEPMDFLFTSDEIAGLEEIFLNNITLKQLVGHEAARYQNILKIHEFVKEQNYKMLIKFFNEYYYSLEISDEFRFKQPIIILTPFYISELEKEKYKDVFLNHFNFPALLFLSESQAILATLQKSSGVVINLGESHTSITTIFHGFTNIMAKDIFPISGKDLTGYLLKLLLSKKGVDESIYLDEIIAKEIKDKLSLCVLNPEEEVKRVKEGFTKYDRIIDLPDGNKLKINKERILLSEPLFDPKIIHMDYVSLANAIANVIKIWERENWEALLSNIILAGGTSLIHGLQKRLKDEIASFFSDMLKPKIEVIAASGRENMGWIGASILYSSGKLERGWIFSSEREINIE